MRHEITWGGDPEDVLVVTTGDASVDELDAMTKEAMADPRFRQGMKILLDHTALRWWAASNEEVERRADLVRRDADQLGRQRIAFVAGSPLDYRIGTMLRELIGDTKIESGVFDSVEAARDWLRAG